MVVDPFHRCSFDKKVGGAHSVKNAQSTLNILKIWISPRIRSISWPNSKGFSEVGNAQALPTEYVPTHS